ncbi:penicillin-binding protein 1C [Halomonadaceae bacterium KBTZ08]
MGIRCRGITAVLLAGAVLAASIWWFCPRPSLYGDTGFSTAVFDRKDELLRLTLAKDERYRLRTSLDDMAPAAVEATLLYEDEWFYHHPGVNPVQLVRAAWTTYVAGDRVMGASTLSMQLARLRFGIDSSSLPGKLVQILRALQLERHYDKNDILEAYLNLAPYGGNVEGLGTASRIYYDKAADELTRLQALTLAVIPQNPVQRKPRSGGDPGALVQARQRLFERWVDAHPDDANLASRVATSLPARERDELPFRAPHFVDRLLEQHESEGRLRTTLDPALQKRTENAVDDHLAANRDEGLNNAAVMVVDSRDVSVRALVGSADWFNDTIAGQVNGTAARRSPGSALKPFIYALALDQGLIHPMTLMEDAPVRYGAYTPENFDRGFTGPVLARDALIYSRNVPALHLASKLQEPDFYRFLKQAGIGNMKPRGFYGLAIALGGIEVTMEEVVRLYAALANRGRQHELALLQDNAKLRPGQRLFSGEAAFITRAMLADNPRPGRREWPGRDNRTGIPWKTGTSYAFRDAWSVGLVGPYVVAVWVGHFDGAGNPSLVGRKAAAPLFFRLVDALRARGVGTTPPSPEGLNVRRVPVCEPTGDLPGQHCPQTTRAWFIPGVSPIRVSNVYREVRIDPDTGRRACPGQHSDDLEKRVYEFWPSNLLTLFRQAGLPRRTPPPFQEECSLTDTAAIGDKPSILTPQSTVTYALRPDRLGQEKIPLQASADADARALFWFVGDQFLGRSEPDEPLFWRPRPGHFELRVVDDLGRSDRISLRVELITAGP